MCWYRGVMLNLEACHQREGSLVGKDIVSASGVIGTCCSAGVVVGYASPLLGLFAQIEKLHVLHGCVKGGEGSGVAI